MSARERTDAFDLDFTPVTEHARLYACPFCGCLVWGDFLHEHRERCEPMTPATPVPHEGDD